MPKHLRHDSNLMTPGSEIHPNDSASVVNDDPEELSDVVVKKGMAADGRSRSRGGHSAVDSAAVAAAVEHDDGTYLFKFLSPSSTTHRFVARHDDFSILKEIISGKLATDPFFTQHHLVPLTASQSARPPAPALDPADFTVHYTDDDGDLVLLSSDHDLQDSVKTARKQGRDRVLLIIKGGKGWEHVMAQTAENANIAQSAQQQKKALQSVQEEADREDEAEVEKTTTSRKKVKADVGDEELVLGFLSKDMVLPAAIAFLGVAVIGVFALSKSSKH